MAPVATRRALASTPGDRYSPLRARSGGRMGSKMSLEDYTLAVVDFVRAHELWAAPIVGALAFGESLAFVSLLLPAWAMLVAIGALISHSSISFWPILTAAAIGAALGDWLSYWIGLKLGPAVAHMWPLSRHPELIPRANGS